MNKLNHLFLLSLIVLFTFIASVQTSEIKNQRRRGRSVRKSHSHRRRSSRGVSRRHGGRKNHHKRRRHNTQRHATNQTYFIEKKNNMKILNKIARGNVKKSKGKRKKQNKEKAFKERKKE